MNDELSLIEFIGYALLGLPIMLAIYVGVLYTLERAITRYRKDFPYYDGYDRTPRNETKPRQRWS